MMRRRTIWVIMGILAATFLGACHPPIMIGPGHGDFVTKIAGDYYLHRTSSHQIMISPEVWNDGTPLIPTKVIECDSDGRFVIAKRQGLKRRSPDDPNDTYKEPDPNVFDFWILDTEVPTVFGPLTEQEFATKRIEIGVPEALTLHDVDDYRPKQMTEPRR